MAGLFRWAPQALVAAVHRQVDTRMRAMGNHGVQVARDLVPVDTGQTRDSIGFTFDQATQTLELYADTRWAIFLELGTSRMEARPFLRPALAAMAALWGGGNLAMGLRNAPEKYASGYRASTGGHVALGRRGLFRKRRTATAHLGRGDS